MRRALGALVVTAWLALAGVVVTAVPASASPTTCTAERRNVAGADLTSTCSRQPILRVLKRLGLSDGCIAQLPTSIDGLRNVGGIAPFRDQCPPWLQNLLVDLGRNIGG